MKLVIGNKNYSSWSLRAWMMLDGFGLSFEEVQESLHADGLDERLLVWSEVGKVPVLIDGSLIVWDSMAICEYVSERYLSGGGWPAAQEERAIARAVCAEMHSGFPALRNEMPMNCRAKRRVVLSEQAQDDIARVDAIWSAYGAGNDDGETRLFGSFSIADCFFAPVVFRFMTYGTALSGPAQQYLDSMLNHPSMQKWLTAARAETEVIEEDEAGTEV